MENLRKNEKIRYFHLVPKTEFYQLKLPRNCDVLEVFFGLKDKLGESEPKKNIALKIYEQICPIYVVLEFDRQYLNLHVTEWENNKSF